ncbi:cyclic nucleotide-gated ion channel 1-like isoform X2 [Malus domestica]|uniref:cyclic nucleotide-gated ion channel 1-like isoform X2 n=1 Tax=Malus domestica TaxID=3750 RepID=UPI00049916D0|nr:cyclic nucleotide-gated ion channel 1-like isoform X2 [Malus domestica]
MANSEIAVVIKYPEEKAEATLPAQNPKEKAEATSLAENPKEKVTSNNPDSSSKDIREESAVEDNHESNIFSPKVDKNPKKESFLQNYWKKIFVASCLCGVLVDPLFLYVPLIKDDVKCLILDQKLKIAAVILRSVTDLFYILDIIFRIYGSENYSDFIKQLLTPRKLPRSRLIRRSCVPTIAKAIWGSNDILIDILAILPLPQVVILIFFSNMRDLRSLTTRMFIMNLFALLQYVPRVLRIYLSCSELKKIPKDEIKQTPIWIKAILNFSMYIIASHVFGAVWYFFAIQRMMECWHSACRKEDGCDSSSFGCHDHHTFRNIKILNDLCPINPSDAKMFDLGIFTSVLESGITGSTNYFQKFSNCFWWGLRNLSSLGSNLEPSVNGWENLFTTSISIIGLLLFLYLIGNLQMYMQFENAKREEHNRKLRLTRRTEQFGPEIELWLFKNGIPTKSHKEMKSQVSEKVQQAIEGNRDVNLDNVLPTLPADFQSRIKKCSPLTKLKQGKPLKEMVFIMDGLVDIEKRNSNGSCNTSQRGAGELCGQDLLLRGSRSNGEYAQAFGQDLLCEYRPNREHAKAFGDVEALVIMAEDMESVRSRFKQQIDAYERYLHVDAYERYLHVHKSEPKRQKVGGRKRSHDIELEISQSC